MLKFRMFAYPENILNSKEFQAQNLALQKSEIRIKWIYFDMSGRLPQNDDRGLMYLDGIPLFF